MFLYGLLLTVCYVPGVTGFALPTGWLVLSATLPWILRSDLWRLLCNPFLLWAILGLLWTLVWQQGVYDVWKLALIAGVFVLGQRSSRSLASLLSGMGLGLTVSTVVAIAQTAKLSGIPFNTMGIPAGLFYNPNILGEVSALVAVGLVAYGLWPLALPALANIAISESRTALLALGIPTGVWLWSRYRLVGPITVLIVALLGTAALFDKSIASAPYRFAIWQSTISGFTLFGRGPGSFISTFPVFATFHTEPMPNREEDAHNEPLQLIYQYGLGTLLLLPALAVGLFGPLGPERYILLAAIPCILLNYPLEVPPSAFLIVFTLGRLWSRRHSLRWYGLARGWALGGWLGSAQLRLSRHWGATIPVEPIHPHQARVLRNGLHQA